jgi:hypothetical protein
MGLSVSELKKNINLTGINMPGGFGVTWEYVTSEKETAASLLTFFENRRVLYHPFSNQCPGKVVISVLQVRSKIQSAMESLGRETYLHQLLALMRKTALSFLEYATANCEGDVSCDDCRVRDTGCLEGLREFRREMGSALAGLCISFDLDVEEQLASIMPLTGGSDSPVKMRVGRKIEEIRRLFEMRKSGQNLGDLRSRGPVLPFHWDD